MKFGSLFAGIGGFDLALERAGFICAWQCEIDPAARSVLARHWPDVRRFEDVRSLTGAEASPVGLLCGGWPCQDLSVAGNRAGLAGERSGLFWEVVRIARDLAPRWLLLENVPGLLSSNGGRDMGAVLWSLGELGYRWAYRVLDAQFFGVPQRRRRVFIVGSLGAGCPGEVLLEPDRLPWDLAPRSETGKGVAGLLAGGARGRGWRVGADEAAGGQIVAFDETQITSGDPSHPLASTARPPTIAQCHGSNVGPMGHLRGGNGNEIGGVPFVAIDYANYSYESAGRARPITGSADRSRAAPIVARPVGVRRLMAVECERLMGLPDDWTRLGALSDKGDEERDKPWWEQSDSARYRMIGNGVAVPVVEWIARRIAAVDEAAREAAA